MCVFTPLKRFAGGLGGIRGSLAGGGRAARHEIRFRRTGDGLRTDARAPCRAHARHRCAHGRAGETPHDRPLAGGGHLVERMNLEIHTTRCQPYEAIQVPSGFDDVTSPRRHQCAKVGLR